MKVLLLLLLLLLLTFFLYDTYAVPCVVNGGPYGGVTYPAVNHHVTSIVQSIDIMFDAAVTTTGYTLDEVAATIEFTSNNNGFMVPQSATVNGNNITLYTKFVSVTPPYAYSITNHQSIYFTGDETNVTAVYRPLELLAGSISVGGVPLFYGQSLCTSWIDRLLPSITNVGVFKTVGAITTYQIMFNKPVSLCSGSTLNVLDFFTSMSNPAGYAAIFGTNKLLPVDNIVPNRLWFFTGAGSDDMLVILTIAPDKFCDVLGQKNVGYNKTTSYLSSYNYQLSTFWVTDFHPFHLKSGSSLNLHLIPYSFLVLDRDHDGYIDGMSLHLDTAVNMTSVVTSGFTLSGCSTFTGTTVQQILPIGYTNSDSFILKLSKNSAIVTGSFVTCTSTTISPLNVLFNSSSASLTTSSFTGTVTTSTVTLAPVIASAVYMPSLKIVTITTNLIASGTVNVTTFRFLTSLSSHATYYSIVNISASSNTYNVTLNDYIRGPLLNDSSTPLKAFITMRLFKTDRSMPYWKGVVMTEMSPRFTFTGAAFKTTNFTEIEVGFATTGLLIESFNPVLFTISCNAVPIAYSTVGLSNGNSTIVIYVSKTACANGLPMTIDAAAHTILDAVAGNAAVVNRTIERIPTMTVSSAIITSDQHLKLVTSSSNPLTYDSFSLINSIEFYCDDKLIPLSFKSIESNIVTFLMLHYCNVGISTIKRLYVPDHTFFTMSPAVVMKAHNNATIVPAVPSQFTTYSTLIKVHPHDRVQVTFQNTGEFNISEIKMHHLKMYCDNVLSVNPIIYNQQISSTVLEFNITSCPVLATTTFEFSQSFIFTPIEVSESASLIPGTPSTFSIASAVIDSKTCLLVINYLVVGIQQVDPAAYNLTCAGEPSNLTFVSSSSSTVTLSAITCDCTEYKLTTIEQAVLTATEMSERAINAAVTIVNPAASLSSVSIGFISTSIIAGSAATMVILSLLPGVLITK